MCSNLEVKASWPPSWLLSCQLQSDRAEAVVQRLACARRSMTHRTAQWPIQLQHTCALVLKAAKCGAADSLTDSDLQRVLHALSAHHVV